MEKLQGIDDSIEIIAREMARQAKRGEEPADAVLIEK